VASNLPIYRAPSITKLSKKNISSSIFRGASVVSASPKLQRSSFSFAKSKNNINVESLGSQENIANTLSETNRILVEIQKQLAFDFATRIAEEKAVVKKIKATESKKRFSAKEAAVESAKKIGSTLNNTFDKVIAPAKNIFSKMVEFFQLILTGIALNVAFKWLQDPSNRQKLDSVFQFIGDHWKEILAVFIGVKIFGVLYKLYRVAKFLKGIIDWILKKPKPPGGGGDCGCDDKNKPKGNGPYDPCAAILNCIKDITGPTAEAFAGKIANTSRFRPLFALLGVTNLKPKPVQSAKPRFTETEFDKKIREGDKPTPIDQYDPANIIMFLRLFGGRGAAGAGTGAELGGSSAALNNIIKFSRSKTLVPRSRGGTIPKFSSGGSVPGRGSGMIDSVKAMLAPGEEVIRTASANLFRPVLKDINENAGRLWVLFSQAVTKLISVTDYQKEVSKQFKKTIEIFDKYLKDEILKKKKSKKPPGGGGGGRSMSMNARSDQKSVSATPKVYNYNLISQGNSSGGMTFLPMNLPPIKSKPPEIPMPSNPATEVPVISSVNMANPYMQLTPEIYGIFV